MKRINQFERTDRDITNALFLVMERKSFEKITVQDILEEAMINRSTFYQHFSDKYAILERLQERYIGGITERMDALAKDEPRDLNAINQVFCTYINEHRYKMKKLLSVRSENLDMEGQMRRLFSRYLEKATCRLSGFEREALAGMLVYFMVYHLEQDTDLQELGQLTLNAWLNMSLYFFRVDDVPNASERLLQLIGQLHSEKEGKLVCDRGY
ncbi:MAG: TetR/AcrR family transcriptional regulator [Firmicutes bacterium]|nr:TetR/AcrR family transcriptional regulator [Bacillota bacterium]